MKKILLASVALTLLSLPAAACDYSATNYQVTGPVLDITPNTIVVQKGKEKWEIAKADAALPKDLKKGDKVTLEYMMVATRIAKK